MFASVLIMIKLLKLTSKLLKMDYSHRKPEKKDLYLKQKRLCLLELSWNLNINFVVINYIKWLRLAHKILGYFKINACF